MANLTAKAIEALRPADRMITIPDGATPGLELYITKGGAKTFSVRYTLPDGTRRRMNLGRWPAVSLASARELALGVMARVARGEDPAFEQKEVKARSRTREIRTLADLCDALLSSCTERGVRDSTIAYWTWLNAKHLRPRLGGLRLEDVTSGRARTALRDIGAEAGPTTANRVHGLLRRALNFGVEEEHLQTNPILRLKPLFNEASRARVLLDVELKSIWATAQETLTPARDGVSTRDELGVSRAMALALLLCATTLQRGGEVIGLRADELDLETRTWILPAERTKANREHVVPLSSLAVELLEEVQQLASLRLGRSPEGRDPLFPSPRDASKAVERLSLTRAMARLSRAAGVQNATPHDLRRTGATILASERIGALSEVVARVLNHAPPGLGVTGIYNRYAYVAEKRRALDVWGSLLKQIVSGELSSSNVVPIKLAR